MVNTILARRGNHIVAKGDNPVWPKGSKSRGFSRAYSLSRGTIRVEGVAVGDRVSVYRTDGIMAGQGIASSTTEDVSANVSTVAIVKVERDGKTIAVKKIRVD